MCLPKISKSGEADALHVTSAMNFEVVWSREPSRGSVEEIRSLNSGTFMIASRRASVRMNDAKIISITVKQNRKRDTSDSSVLTIKAIMAASVSE